MNLRTREDNASKTRVGHELGRLTRDCHTLLCPADLRIGTVPCWIEGFNRLVTFPGRVSHRQRPVWGPVAQILNLDRFGSLAHGRQRLPSRESTPWVDFRKVVSCLLPDTAVSGRGDASLPLQVHGP